MRKMLHDMCRSQAGVGSKQHQDLLIHIANRHNLLKAIPPAQYP